MVIGVVVPDTMTMSSSPAPVLLTASCVSPPPAITLAFIERPNSDAYSFAIVPIAVPALTRGGRIDGEKPKMSHISSDQVFCFTSNSRVSVACDGSYVNIPLSWYVTQSLMLVKLAVFSHKEGWRCFNP